MKVDDIIVSVAKCGRTMVKYLDFWLDTPTKNADNDARNIIFHFYNPDLKYVIHNNPALRQKHCYPFVSGRCTRDQLQALHGILRGRLERWVQIGVLHEEQAWLREFEFRELLLEGYDIRTIPNTWSKQTAHDDIFFSGLRIIDQSTQLL